jgi:membrane protease YdiL (CAAX protease family)
MRTGLRHASGLVSIVWTAPVRRDAMIRLRPLSRSSLTASGPLARAAAVVAVVAAYYTIQLLTRVLAVYPHLPLPEPAVRPGSWVRHVDHHLWQMSLALLAIGALSRGRWSEWGLNLHNARESLAILRRFCWIYGVYFVGGGLLVQLLFLGPPAVDHPLTPFHVVGRLAFGFLLVGVSEEILFRGLFHTWLARSWTGAVRLGGVEIPTAGVVAALVFTLAHVGFRMAPFEVFHLVPLQLLQALVLGLFYSWAYHRTGSLLAPIVAHNFSDGVLWLGEYLLIGLESR